MDSGNRPITSEEWYYTLAPLWKKYRDWAIVAQCLNLPEWIIAYRIQMDKNLQALSGAKQNTRN